MKEICMMQSKGKITRTNAMDIIRRFAKEYRKALGKAPGGSIMLNYQFRDATQDFDLLSEILLPFPGWFPGNLHQT